MQQLLSEAQVGGIAGHNPRLTKDMSRSSSLMIAGHLPQMADDLLRARIRERLGALGLSARAASLKAGFGPDLIRDLMRHPENRLMSDSLGRLAEALDTTSAYLLGEIDEPATVQPGPREKAATFRQEPSGLTSKIPVMGMAAASEEGWELWNGEVVGFADRPPNMTGVANAYAVYVVSDSMEPRYFAGETLFVNPARPVTPGSHVLVQTRPLHEGDTPRAFVKRLLRVSGSKITLEQYNPRKTFDIQRKDIVSIHRIMASGE
jgi:phage repressor protein C with HTH and peptisase S24 domain